MKRTVFYVSERMSRGVVSNFRCGECRTYQTTRKLSRARNMTDLHTSDAYWTRQRGGLPVPALHVVFQDDDDPYRDVPGVRAAVPARGRDAAVCVSVVAAVAGAILTANNLAFW